MRPKPRASYLQTTGMTRVQGFLSFCGAVNALGLLARLPYLPWSHPYFSTMGATLLLAVVALRACRRSELAALNLFCWGALPLTMLAAANEKQLHPELAWSVQMVLPLLGLLAIAFLESNNRSMLAYCLGAGVSTAWMIGALYGRLGGAGVAAFGIGLLGLLLSFWLKRDPTTMLQEAREEQAELRGEVEVINEQRQSQEILNNGPP